MQLAAWRKREGKTQGWLASELGCSQSYISQIERAHSPIIPGPALMEKIFVLTAEAVMPNDFYDVPRWRRVLAAALSVLRKRAA